MQHDAREALAEPAKPGAQAPKPDMAVGVKNLEADAAAASSSSLSEVKTPQPETPQPAGPIARLRNFLIRALPAVLVNHTSNLFGGLQLGAEVLMAKSGNVTLIEDSRKGNPLNYLIDPPRNIITSSLKSGGLNFKPKDLLRASYYKDSIHGFLNLEHASKIDSLGGTLKLTNRWTARASLLGIIGMTVAVLFPDEKDSQQETEENVKQSRIHPLAYAKKRLHEALDPREWVQHKRSFTGLMLAGSGVFSFLSGFRQIEGKVIGQQIYRHNNWHKFGGAVLIASGAQLALSVDNQQGWSRWGATNMLRLISLPLSISGRFKPGVTGKLEQGRWWYIVAQVMFQMKNTLAALIGGAEVRPDGTIVDHKAIREAAREKTKQEIDRIAPKPTAIDGVAPQAQADTPPATVQAEGRRHLQTLAPAPDQQLAPASA